MKFSYYYHKKRQETPPVGQPSVKKDNRLCCRLSQDTWTEIDEFMEDNGLTNLSNTVETLLSDSLLDYKIEKYKKELEGI